MSKHMISTDPLSAHMIKQISEQIHVRIYIITEKQDGVQ